MNISQAMGVLFLSKDQVTRLVRTGEIAGAKAGRMWVLDPESVREWKQKRPTRPERRGAAWRKGMLLTRRQWRCAECGTIGQRDTNSECYKCGAMQPKKGKK